MFHSCNGFDGLSLLFSLASPSRSNKDKYCLVKGNFLNYLEVGCNLRNCSTETKKKFYNGSVEVDQMIPDNWTLKSCFFIFFSNVACPGPLLNVLVLK